MGALSILIPTLLPFSIVGALAGALFLLLNENFPKSLQKNKSNAKKIVVLRTIPAITLLSAITFFFAWQAVMELFAVAWLTLLIIGALMVFVTVLVVRTADEPFFAFHLIMFGIFGLNAFLIIAIMMRTLFEIM